MDCETIESYEAVSSVGLLLFKILHYIEGNEGFGDYICEVKGVQGRYNTCGLSGRGGARKEDESVSSIVPDVESVLSHS